MSDFLWPPPEPPPPSPPWPALPPWTSASSGTLPGVVPVEILLAPSATAAVCVSRLAAYPTGFELDVMTLAHPDGDEVDPLLFGVPGRRHDRVLGDGLRLAVQFSTGAEATSIGGAPGASPTLEAEGPLVQGGAGGGGGGNWHRTYWVSPLPPPGPLAFVSQSPAAGIPLTRLEIDAQVILDAARRALVIIPDAPAAGGNAASATFVPAASEVVSRRDPPSDRQERPR